MSKPIVRSWNEIREVNAYELMEFLQAQVLRRIQKPRRTAAKRANKKDRQK